MMFEAITTPLSCLLPSANKAWQRKLTPCGGATERATQARRHAAALGAGRHSGMPRGEPLPSSCSEPHAALPLLPSHDEPHAVLPKSIRTAAFSVKPWRQAKMMGQNRMTSAWQTVRRYKKSCTEDRRSLVELNVNGGRSGSGAWTICKACCDALPRHPPPRFLLPSLEDMPPSLPWLLLSSAGFGSTNGARFIGTYADGWLFIAVNQTHGHALLNLRTRHPELSRRMIPHQLSLQDALRLDNMAILAATLSAPPDDALCLGAAIVTHWRFVSGPPMVMFWRMGDVVAVDARSFGQSMLPHLEVRGESSSAGHRGQHRF
ncbi:hypothetical protein HU200_049581 [Digitaria exilis]|uniref:Uncharacterized protein n=1 Tax=Digitaria exilis TaxID=1010633 RepID=A0A835E8C7_9POAL|nr:hypothetical protein HU200_049581 [Digitaria exilis]